MRTEIGQDVFKAASLLRAGELVAFPTETVYGLGALAEDSHAVAQVFHVKNRPTFDPLIVHLPSLAAAEAWVGPLEPALRVLAVAFWPGPLTLLVPKPPTVPELVTAGLPRVGIRVPSHPLALELLRAVGKPIAAPSANPFGYVSPTTAAHVVHQLGDTLAYVIDGGPTAVGVESTIVGLEGTVVTVYRLGGTPIEALEREVGMPVVIRKGSSRPQAPGELESHYAPHKTTVLHPSGQPLEPTLGALRPSEVGYLAFQHVPQPPGDEPWGWQAVLSATGDLAEAAARLFALLRAADASRIRLLVAEPVPDVGLGRAINDRLQRASHRR